MDKGIRPNVYRLIWAVNICVCVWSYRQGLLIMEPLRKKLFGLRPNQFHNHHWKRFPYIHVKCETHCSTSDDSDISKSNRSSYTPKTNRFPEIENTHTHKYACARVCKANNDDKGTRSLCTNVINTKAILAQYSIRSSIYQSIQSV